MDYFTIDGQYYTSNLNAYIGYLKEESKTVSSEDLETSLDEILDSPDAESVVNITDASLKAAGSDFAKKNEDKLMACGVSQDRLQAVFGAEISQDGTKETEKAEGITNNFSELRARHSQEEENTKAKIKDANKVASKNEQKIAKVNESMKNATEKNNVLKEQYNALKLEVTNQQETNEKNNKAQNDEYDEMSVGKMDPVKAMQTEKYQELDQNSVRMASDNFFIDGFVQNYDQNNTKIELNLNATDDKLNNSIGYAIAGKNMIEIGTETANSSLAVNDRSISLAQEGQSMMNSDDDAKKAEGQEVYTRAMKLVESSFETITGGQDVIDSSSGFYTEANKYTSGANQTMSMANISLNNINSNNEDLTLKINELQSLKV